MSRIFKFIVYIVVGFTFINGVVAVGYGAYLSGLTYFSFFNDGPVKQPLLTLVKSLDIFLISFVFMIFSLGFAQLWNLRVPIFPEVEMKWLEIKTFSDLKLLLWNSLLLALAVLYTTHVYISMKDLDWTLLIVPAAILLLSIAGKQMKH